MYCKVYARAKNNASTFCEGDTVMVDADLADQIRLEIQQKYPPKHGSLSRFCDDKGFNNSRVSDALNPDVDTKVSTLIAIADALDCDVILEPRDK